MNENKNNILSNDKKPSINELLKKLANSNDIQSYKNKIVNCIEENKKKILGLNNVDRKYYLLLTRTYYLNELEKIEQIVNIEEMAHKKGDLTQDNYLNLLSYLNILIYFEDLYIFKNDNLRGLKLQAKIIEILKNYL
jgi:hypothetical protein